MPTQMEFGGITADVVFKDIKNVHLSVYPPTGRVRISAPSRMSLDTIRVFRNPHYFDEAVQEYHERMRELYSTRGC